MLSNAQQCKAMESIEKQCKANAQQWKAMESNAKQARKLKWIQF